MAASIVSRPRSKRRKLSLLFGHRLSATFGGRRPIGPIVVKVGMLCAELMVCRRLFNRRDTPPDLRLLGANRGKLVSQRADVAFNSLLAIVSATGIARTTSAYRTFSPSMICWCLTSRGLIAASCWAFSCSAARSSSAFSARN